MTYIYLLHILLEVSFLVFEALLLLVLVPVILGLSALIPLGSVKARMRAVVGLSSISMVLGFFLIVQAGGGLVELSGMFDYIITILDFGLLLYFVYIGVKEKHSLILSLSALQIPILTYVELYAHGVGSKLFVDTLALIMLSLVVFLGSTIAFYALAYMPEHEEHLGIESSRQPRFFLFILLFLGSMSGLVLANDLKWFYFFWEITSLCSYQLIRHDETKESIGNALSALWVLSIGGVTMISAIAYLAYGGYDLSILHLIEASRANPQLFMIPISLLLISAFNKAAQVPFNGWILKAMVAPTPVSALLHSSTLVKAGVYLVIRLAPAFYAVPITVFCAVVGAISFAFGAVLAIGNINAKRVLAYSTMSNLGLITLCAGINTSLAVMAAILLMVFHAVSKALLFLFTGVVESKLHSRLIEDMEGLIDKMPWITFTAIIGMFSMFLPPFWLLASKWLAVEAISGSQASWFIVPIILVAIGSSATTVVYTKWLGKLICRSVESKAERLHVQLLYNLTLTALALAVLVSAIAFIFKPDVLIAPALTPWYLPPSISTTLGYATGFGTFLLLPLAIVVALTFTVSWILSKRKVKRVLPYLSGENTGDDGLSFYTIADTVERSNVGSFYFSDEFERKFTSFMRILTSLILIGMLVIALWMAI
jgi:ech hydrogenase subunit A